MSYNFNNRTKWTALNFYNMYKEEISMKKKKALSLVMAAVLALGVVPGTSVWAEEQEVVVDDSEINGFSALDENVVTDYDESEFVSNINQINENESNGLLDENKSIEENSEFTDEILEDTNDIAEYQTNIETGKYGYYTTNIIEPNKYYKMNEMCRDYGNDYYLELNLPVSGRAKIVVSDVTELVTDTGDDWKYDSGIYANWGEYVIDGINAKDSGWISVKSGKAVFVIYSRRSSINKEAQVMIQYEEVGQYVGEVEDNDTFDTANIIENNVVYEGNSSKGSDKDYYRFEMKQSGLAEIISNKCTYNLYEEDENNNVYQITYCKSSDDNSRKYTNRVRLAAGKYYLLMRPDRWADCREYSFSVNTTYESPDDFEQENNNVKSMANEKKTNHWYAGNMNTEEDIDCFKMTILEDSFLSMEFKVPRQIQKDTLKIGLYDSSMENVLSEATNTENPYLKTKEILCPAGVYYVRVENVSKYSELQFVDDYSFNLNQRPYKYVTVIKIPSTQTITEGQSFTMTPTITPSDAEDTSVKWSSSNPYVATVDENGKVTAKAVGTTDIVVTAADRGTVSATCTLTVQERVIKYVTEIGIAGEKSVKQGTAFSVAPVITPGDAENKALRWQSSNPAVVEVDSNGNMMANRCGTARITVTAQDRDMVSASCVVTVYNTVRYNLNGGTNNGGNPSTFYGNTTNLLNPTRRGYTFSGWYSDKGFKKKVTQITSGNVGNTTFYAKWKKVSVRKTTITSFANKSGKKALVKYKAISGASGYEIVYSTDKKVKKNRTTVKTKAKSRTLKGLKKGKTYYVKVRAYKTDSTGLVVYGKYSAIKKVKIKK